MEFSVRTMFKEEAPQVAAISEAAFGDTAWKERDLANAVESGAAEILIARNAETKEIVGYGVFYHASDQAELNSIAIKEEYRHMGAGSAIMRKASKLMKDGGASKLFLEVRRSNEAAVKFYEKHKFMTSDIRRNFYNDPREDALVMVKILRLM